MSAPAIRGSAYSVVGRSRELDQIAALQASGVCPGVVIHAEAGVGKSRLARAAVAAFQATGAKVGWVQATRSAATVPLGAFAGLLPEDVRSDDLLALLRQSVASLRGDAAGRALVMGVDDAHCLDPTSAALVQQLAITRSAFLVVTVRAGEPCPDAVESLWKDLGAARLELGPLTEAETTELVEGTLGGPVEQRAAHWVFDRSRGNALYALALLDGAAASGSLAQVRGFWRMVDAPPVSESLGDLIAERLASLGKGERRAVELLAFGEPLPLQYVIDLVGGEESIASAEEQHLVVLEGTLERSAVRLAHPLYGEVVRRTVPMTWARELRLRLADLLRGHGPLGPDDALRVARWLLDAGEPLPVDLLVDAAGAALGAGDPELGAELAALALDASQAVEPALLLARAHAARQRYEEAAVVLERARARIDSPRVALEYLELCIEVLFWGPRRDEELRGLLERARDWWPDGQWRQQLYPLEIYVAELDAPYGSTVARSEEMLAEPDLDAEVRRRVQNIHVSSLFYAGRTLESLALATELRPGVPLLRSNDDYALSNWTMFAFEVGQDWAGFERELSELLRVAVPAGDHAAIGVLALALGSLRFAGGLLDDASRWLAEAELQFERHDVYGSLCVARALQVEVLAAKRDLDAIEPALARCHEALGGAEARQGERPYVARAEAWARYALGDAPAAQRRLLDAAGEAVALPLYAVQLGYDAMRAGAPASVALRTIDGAGGRCDAPLIEACVAHLEACAARDPFAALAASERLDGLGAIVFAIRAAVDAANLFAEAGREDSARRAASRAHALQDRTQGLGPLTIARVEHAAIALTTREGQLVELARQGLSNAEIADRLVLSVRTVESHIYNAMQKLGVRDRKQL